MSGYVLGACVAVTALTAPGSSAAYLLPLWVNPSEWAVPSEAGG